MGSKAFGERFEQDGAEYEVLGSYWKREKMESDRDWAIGRGVAAEAVLVIDEGPSGSGENLMLAFRADQVPAARDALYGPGLSGRPAE